ncbi:hypothetical protein AOQ84DRAFT_194465 [Glonium stellatum]|uniref:Uncharacterized protein n=1 Tax=Glonium stellatum TaxID=574774 RepID=A0A8E2JLY5_9PEZI|nr:hypothetical protein AOQ84DRAFT_194465 [Glonium stellatum]
MRAVFSRRPYSANSLTLPDQSQFEPAHLGDLGVRRSALILPLAFGSSIKSCFYFPSLLGLRDERKASVGYLSRLGDCVVRARIGVRLDLSKEYLYGYLKGELPLLNQTALQTAVDYVRIDQGTFLRATGGLLWKMSYRLLLRIFYREEGTSRGELE